MARRGARTHVELVEDDTLDHDLDGARRPPGERHGRTPGSSPADAPDASPPSHRGRRRALTAGVALLVVLGTVATVGQVREAARERDRLAAVATMPDGLAPLDGTLDVLWRADDLALLWATARTPDGLLVSTDNAEDGASTARAFDPGTGDVVWERELFAGSRSDPVPDGGIRGGYCVAHGTDGDLLACLASDARYVLEGDRVHHTAPAVTRLLLLDPRDGVVAADLSDAVAGTGAAPSFVVLGDLVVVGSVVGEGDEGGQVVAVAPDGEVAWRTTFPVPTAAGPSPLDRGRYADVIGLGEHVLVATAGELRLLDAGGATVRSHRLGRDEVLTGVMGSTALTQIGPGRTSQRRTADGELFGASGGTGIVRADHVADVTGAWVRIGIDDGSADGLVLTRDADGLHGWDADGTRRWTVDVRSTFGWGHVLAGRVHLPVGDELVALDARTGAELWRRGDVVVDDEPLTDGRHLLVRTDHDPGADLLALDTTDGTVAWRTRFPPMVEALDGVFGLLVGYGFFGDDGPDERAVVFG